MTSVDFVMPSLGADMEAGTITEWMVGAGDTVDRGDIVAIVETDKADIDIEVWDSGTVETILVPPGELVAVGTPLARLMVAEAGRPMSMSARTESPPIAAVSSRPTGSSPTKEQALGPRNGIPSSPLARRLAKERGIDLTTVAGTGPGGAIVAVDLSKIDKSGPDAGLTESAKPTTGPMRRAIAELLTRSKREIPHYYLATDIDLELMFSWLSEANVKRSMEDRILPAAVLLKAIANATAKHREFNGFWQDEGFAPGGGVHLGVAVSLRGGGLIAPAIHDADQLTIDELMASLRDVVGRTRSGRLRSSEMNDPTITVSNLGDRGVDVVYGVIYPPQVALVGLGKIARRPSAVGDAIVARRQVTITLAADHRATDGQVGARFLNSIDRLLQTPETL